jgi:hypothetical protein
MLERAIKLAACGQFPLHSHLTPEKKGTYLHTCRRFTGLASSLPRTVPGVDHMRITRIAYGLTGLLLLHLLNPTVAWLALAAGFVYIAGQRRRRPLRGSAVAATR